MSSFFKSKSAPAKISPGHFYTPNQLELKALFASRQGKLSVAQFYYSWANYLRTRNFHKFLVRNRRVMRHKYLAYCKRDKNWLKSRADKLRAELPVRSIRI